MGGGRWGLLRRRVGLHTDCERSQRSRGGDGVGGALLSLSGLLLLRCRGLGGCGCLLLEGGFLGGTDGLGGGEKKGEGNHFVGVMTSTS